MDMGTFIFVVVFSIVLSALIYRGFKRESDRRASLLAAAEKASRALSPQRSPVVAMKREELV